MIKCVLGRCSECPSPLIPTLEKQTDEMVTYQKYQYHSYCQKHKSLEGAPTSCPFCKAKGNESAKGRRVIRKQQLTRLTARFGTFIEDELWKTTMKRYAYHMFCVALLGKGHCIGLRRNAYKEINGAITILRDYADRLLCSFPQEIQSTHFGENATVSMEGVCVRYGDPTVLPPLFDEKYVYHCFLADSSPQDSRSSYLNTVKLVQSL